MAAISPRRCDERRKQIGRSDDVKAHGRHYRTSWLNSDGRAVDIIDQRLLPHGFKIETICSVEAMAVAIREMWVRGAPLIGVAAAYGLALQTTIDASDAALLRTADQLRR